MPSGPTRSGEEWHDFENPFRTMTRIEVPSSSSLVMVVFAFYIKKPSKTSLLWTWNLDLRFRVRQSGKGRRIIRVMNTALVLSSLSQCPRT